MSQARFKVAVCGRRWGKTFFLREQLLFQSQKPGSTVIYVAPTRGQAKDIMWRSLKDRISELNWACKINEAELTVLRGNGSSIELKSAEKPGRLRGRGIDLIAMDEFAEYRTDEIWHQVARPALSDKRGKALFAMTPKGFNHGYDIFNEAKTADNWESFSFKTIDAPFFQTAEGQAELADAKANLSSRDYRQEYEASFENFAGRIYSSFERKSCSTEVCFSSGLTVYVGADFNRSPMAWCLFHEISGVLHQFGEVFLNPAETPEACEVVRQRCPNSNIIVIPDATGNRKTSNSAVSDHAHIARAGFRIQCQASNPRKVDRWSAVNRAFEKGLVKVNIKTCPYTVRDLEVLCYKEGTCEPMLTDPMLGHISDGFGYAVHQKFPIVGKVTTRSYA